MEKPQVLAQSNREAVVFKPAGIATQLSDDKNGSSLESILKQTLGKKNIYFPHRLDRITQGLILVCFDPETVNFYNSEIRNKQFGKYYLAKIETKLENPQSLIGIQKRFIKVDSSMSRIVKSGGLPSFLEIIAFEKTPDSPECFHVLLKLITGRMHQIRVMLADMGIPLCGDFLYNHDSKYKDFYLESIIISFNNTESARKTYFFENNPDRDEISDDMISKIRKIFSSM